MEQKKAAGAAPALVGGLSGLAELISAAGKTRKSVLENSSLRASASYHGDQDVDKGFQRRRTH